MTDASLADLVALAKKTGITLTTAESCTAGMISAALTDIAGTSAIFERGYVVYSNTAKVDMLNVSPQTLADHGAVSEPVVAQMAKGALGLAKADYAVAVSGIAGPGGSDHKPEGRVCFGVASSTSVVTKTHEFGAIGRGNVRAATVSEAVAFLYAQIVSGAPN